MPEEEGVQRSEDGTGGKIGDRAQEPHHRHDQLKPRVEEERLPRARGKAPAQRGADPESSEERGNDGGDAVDRVPEEEGKVL